MHAHEEEEEEHHSEASQAAADAASRVNAPSHGQGTLAGGLGNNLQEDEEVEAGEGLVCAILVKTKSPAAYSQLSAQYSRNAKLLVINPSTVLREVLSQVDTSTRIVYILCAIILVMNILVISVITVLNLIDSKKEIALMRMIGISMRRIREMYLIQNGLMGLVSTLLSLLICHAALFFINAYTSGMGIVMNPYRLYPVEILIALGVFALSVLPTLLCIWAMSRKDALSH